MEGKRRLQGKSPRVHGMVDAFRYRVSQKRAEIFLTKVVEKTFAYL